MKNKKLTLIWSVILLIVLLILGYFSFFYSPYKFRGEGTIKIFILNTYHPDFPFGLVNESIRGFYDSLEQEGIKDYEIKEFDMDLDRKDSESSKLETAIEAKNLIDEWEPDLIFATNDDAQKYVISRYYLNSNIPVVFANVANNPEAYGFEFSRNVAGVFQTPLFSEAINFLRELFPNAEKIVVISENDSRWANTISNLRKEQNQIPNVKFIGWHNFSNYKEFQAEILYYQDKTDAFLFTPFDNLKDDSGKNVLFLNVTQWISENSHIPEISLWQTPKEGMFVAVTYSPYEQGKEAGKIAYKILIDGKKPASIGFKSLKMGDKYLNLARAKTLGLEKSDIPSRILINSKISENFPWEEKNESK